jgi:hypothetical protein
MGSRVSREGKWGSSKADGVPTASKVQDDRTKLQHKHPLAEDGQHHKLRKLLKQKKAALTSWIVQELCDTAEAYAQAYPPLAFSY